MDLLRAFLFRWVVAAFAGLVCTGAWAQTADPTSQRCLKCHEEQAGILNALHGAKADARTPFGSGKGCQACHGDASAHLANSKNPVPVNFDAKHSADIKNGTCLTCHSAGSKRSHWEGSAHQTQDVACASCHTVHSTDKVLTKITQPEVCFACHKQQRVEVNRTFRHPILEGKVACSDCHNPHGSIGKALMKRDSVVETCYQCHAEKRGPFVHAHEPVQEDCSVCHNPHGTVADSMLKVRPPFLCHQCHTPHGGVIAQVRGQRNTEVLPGTTAAQLTGTTRGRSAIYVTQGRGCMNCHTQIHGGNNPGLAPTPQFMFR